MHKIEMEEMKSLELAMLVDFANFCDKHHFKYYLSGGTLLGAIRHKGFIPWDDDIDIMMPREDYNSCMRLYSHNYYEIDSLVNNSGSYLRYARLYDRRTVLYSPWKKKMNESVFIDIFPIDGLPIGKVRQEILFLVQQILMSLHLATILRFTVSNRYNDRDAGILAWRKYFRTFIKFVMQIAIGWTSPNTWARILNKIASKYSFYNQDEVAVLVSGPHGNKERMPKKIYNDCSIEFEGYNFNTISGYDYYLRKLYGKYMELPPLGKRNTHHAFDGYLK